MDLSGRVEADEAISADGRADEEFYSWRASVTGVGTVKFERGRSVGAATATGQCKTVYEAGATEVLSSERRFRTQW